MSRTKKRNRNKNLITQFSFFFFLFLFPIDYLFYRNLELIWLRLRRVKKMSSSNASAMLRRKIGLPVAAIGILAQKELEMETSSGFKPEIELDLPIGMNGIKNVALSMIYQEAEIITFTCLVIPFRGNGISPI